MTRRAVVLGASGQLGVELVSELKSRNWVVAAWDRAHADITDHLAIESALARFEPYAVFNSAAYNQVDIAEKEPQAAFQVNALAVRTLAMACRQADARFIHFSTDYVFDGAANRPYVEADPTHPLGAYAVSKLAGELYTQAYLEKPLIVRTCGVYGPGGLRTARGNFVELMLRLAKSGNPIRVVEDHFASPTYAPLLAARTIDLVERRESGVFHIGGGETISWFEFAKLIFAAGGVNPSLTPTNEKEYRTPAKRPKYSPLSNSKMEAAGVEPMPSVAEALKLYFTARANYTPAGV